MGYERGDIGIVPRPHSRLPTRRDGMRRLMVAQKKQARMLIDELTKKPTDPTTTSLVRVSLSHSLCQSTLRRFVCQATYCLLSPFFLPCLLSSLLSFFPSFLPSFLTSFLPSFLSYLPPFSPLPPSLPFPSPSFPSLRFPPSSPSLPLVPSFLPSFPSFFFSS